MAHCAREPFFPEPWLYPVLWPPRDTAAQTERIAVTSNGRSMDEASERHSSHFSFAYAAWPCTFFHLQLARSVQSCAQTVYLMRSRGMSCNSCMCIIDYIYVMVLLVILHGPGRSRSCPLRFCAAPCRQEIHPQIVGAAAGMQMSVSVIDDGSQCCPSLTPDHADAWPVSYEHIYEI